ncbi:MAG: hypothetical protein H6819_06680 [Phycisphaerales bacterium]|nr:hypothetical protein [Phycisphaerales bacterium]MCB9855266.1 hypothetical protein [Phycisphaerales bacterium]MCB9862859.1 hypothetical protein [Phycisphaerales bacterium]
MQFRDIALITGISFAFDLTTLPAVAEDELLDAINRNDETVVLRKERQDNPSDDDINLLGG